VSGLTGAILKKVRVSSMEFNLVGCEGNHVLECISFYSFNIAGIIIVIIYHRGAAAGVIVGLLRYDNFMVGLHSSSYGASR